MALEGHRPAVEAACSPQIPEPTNNATIDDAIADLTVDETIEGEGAFTDFIDQDPIVGGLTVVDLTASSCRWPSGNPRDLATFRYCGEAAHAGPYCEHHVPLAYLRKAA
jgi:GcrA cell cycle regulator